MFRIKELRESRKMNMREAARMLNLPYTTYVNYEKGFREPTSEVLIQIADFYDVTVDYLLGRSGDSSVPVPTEHGKNLIRQNYLVRDSWNIELSEAELILIRKYRCLDERGQASVRNILDHEYNSLPGEKAVSRSKEA